MFSNRFNRWTVAAIALMGTVWATKHAVPEMRKTGMVMRWYKGETSGWVHDSMVEFVTPEPK